MLLPSYLSKEWARNPTEGRLQAFKACLALTVEVFALPPELLVRVIAFWQLEQGKVTAAAF